jgi:hypothetical protein
LISAKCGYIGQHGKAEELEHRPSPGICFLLIHRNGCYAWGIGQTERHRETLENAAKIKYVLAFLNNN